ncbi:hypothetical protein DFH27DRAFT_529681 [Peziza echinospora]|nr:hypothetical protein DFH27DRAFT_529681 [Peziza echinospora]
MGPRRTHNNYNGPPARPPPAGGAVGGNGPVGGMNSGGGGYEQRRAYPYPTADDRRREPVGNRAAPQYPYPYRPPAANAPPTPAYRDPVTDWQSAPRMEMGQRRDTDSRGSGEEEIVYRGRREREAASSTGSFQDQGRGGYNAGLRGGYNGNNGNSGFNNYNNGVPNPRDGGAWKPGPPSAPPPQPMYYGSQYQPYPIQPTFNNPPLPTATGYAHQPPMSHMQNNPQAPYMNNNRGWVDASNVPRPPQYPVPPMILSVPQQHQPPVPPSNWQSNGGSRARQFTDGRPAPYYGNNNNHGAYPANDANSYNNFGNHSQPNGFANTGFQNMQRDHSRDSRGMNNSGNRQTEPWSGGPNRGWSNAVEPPYAANKAPYHTSPQNYQNQPPSSQHPLGNRPHQTNSYQQTPQPYQPASNTPNNQMPGRRPPHPAASPLPVPHPTKEYLEASAVPPTSAAEPPRMLIILDLNGALLFRNKNARNTMSSHPTLRPHLAGFLEYLFANFSVMVWSSAQPQNVKAMVQAAFSKEQRDKLVAVWGRDTLGLTQKQVYMKVVVYKNLDRVWAAKLGQRPKKEKIEGEEANTDAIEVTPTQSESAPEIVWSQNNTILIDDSVVKATSQPYNHVLITEYTNPREQANDTALMEVMGYLDEIRAGKYTNVSAFIRSRPFSPGSKTENWGEVGKEIISDLGYDESDGGVMVPMPEGNRKQRRQIANEIKKKERREKKKAAKKEGSVDGSDPLEPQSSDSEASSHTAKPTAVVENVPSRVASPAGKAGGGVSIPKPAAPAVPTPSRAGVDEDILVWSEDESGDEGADKR